jgi:hypothetical protein
VGLLRPRAITDPQNQIIGPSFEFLGTAYAKTTKILFEWVSGWGFSIVRLLPGEQPQ